MSRLGEMDSVRKSGWYWGSLTAKEAYRLLEGKPEGSFIVRDSSDERCIFTLSIKTKSDIVHIRIGHQNGKFTLGFPYCDSNRCHSTTSNNQNASTDTSYSSSSLTELIDFLVENSRPCLTTSVSVENLARAPITEENNQQPTTSGKNAAACQGRGLKFFLKPEAGENGRPAEQIHLIYPLTRLTTVPSLQHLCRFEILRYVRRDNISKLPLPKRLRQYLKHPKNIVEYR